MTLYTKGENKIGYKITVWSSTGYTTSYRGLSEGNPMIDQKVKSKLISTLPTMGLKTLVGGGLGVSAIFATAGFAGGVLGNGVSALLMETLDRTLLNKARLMFANPNKTTSIGVTLAGDFQASYKIESLKDLKALPGLLSIIPATFKVNNKPYWMGKAVVKCLANEQLGACLKGGNINVRYTIDV